MINKKTYPIIHPLRYVENEPDFYTSIVEGEGAFVKDSTGKVYIDGMSGLWNMSFGYKNERIDQAIIEQLKKIPYVNMVSHTNPTTVQFSEMLLELLPSSMDKLLFTCTGSESAELSLKLARKYFDLKGQQKKKNILALDLSYHGTYYGSMSASGIDQEITTGYGPRVPGFIFVETPYSFGHRAEDQIVEEQLDLLENMFKEHCDETAAFIVEPVIGSGGVIPISDRYLQRVRELCDHYEILLIFDEVATGFGRTGKLFGFHHSQAAPDMICLSKGINGGYLPLGVTALDKKISEVFSTTHTHVEHLSTQNGNPLACAAGIATLEILQSPGFITEIEEKGNYLINELKSQLSEHPRIKEIRGKGLMIGIELCEFDNPAKLMNGLDHQRIMHQLKDKGLLAYPYSTNKTSGFTLFLPFIMTFAELDKVSKIITRVLNRY